MAILTKDGKEYRTLTEPNPLVLEQDRIEQANLTFHNFKWKEEIKKSEAPKTVSVKPVKASNMEDFLKEVCEVKKEIKEFKPQSEPETAVSPIPPIISKPEPEPLEDGYVEIGDESILIVHVLPITLVEITDQLYGETKEVRRFGTKFETDSVLLGISDLSIKLLSEKEIELNSVIYPSKYKNGDNAGINRWWKVTSVKKSDEHYLIEGILTDFHPDFSS